MPLKGMSQVKANAAKFVKQVEAINEKALTMIGAVIISRAKFYVPIDTANLINSDFRQVEDAGEGVTRLRVGFTAFYALPLHGTDTYTPLWKPRPAGTKVYDQGKGNGPRIKTGQNMDASPQFLSRGVDESQSDIMKIIESEYRKV